MHRSLLRGEVHPREVLSRSRDLAETCIAAIHGGSTRSSGLLASETGYVYFACCEAKGLNRRETSEETALKVLQTFHTLLLRNSSLPNAQARCKRLILAPAGLCEQLDESQFHEWIDSSAWIAVEPVVVSDARAALLAGALQDSGILIMAGSTSVAYGRTSAGAEWWVGGGASPIGNDGSGFSIAREALNAILRRHDGRLENQGAALEACILAHPDRSNLTSLLNWLTVLRDKGALLQLATIAPDVTLAADLHRDPVAQAILENAAAELLKCFSTVVKRLAFTEERIPVIIAGGVIENCKTISSILMHEIPRREPRAVVSFPRYRPLAGALLFGLSAGQQELLESAHSALEESLRNLSSEQVALLVGPATREWT